MKTLDKYVARNFIVGYVITTMVLIGLCTLIDLFVNLDEFAERSGEGTSTVLSNIYDYYSVQSTLWFRDLAGMITVIAAVFSLARMTYSNELIAIMASGVSLKRVMIPIIILSMMSMGLLVLNQEYVIPRLAHDLIRSHDEDISSPEEIHDLWFMGDDKGSLICTRIFDPGTDGSDGNPPRLPTMLDPVIILRRQVENELRFEVTDIIRAEKAVYDKQLKRWDLTDGRYLLMDIDLENPNLNVEPRKVDFYSSSITPREIPLKQQEGFKSLLSYRQLVNLEKEKGTRISDRAELYLQKHSRITDPVINMVMLLIALPVLVCRDPKQMKSAIMKSFALTGLCFAATFVCKMFATEQIFDRARPELWAWAPIIIFLPIAFVEIDGMKT